ncbi:hypothetical protein ACIRO1_35100 [Streptomyces sp. NPDC102381]|uniref:hypothetical protein n=1 Tax=Streptomyces sp. NPDC102381 TaxID=3366164 RepID=UPI0038305BFC
MAQLLTEVLVPLLERSSPDGAHGYGGRLQLVLGNLEADRLGGADLLQRALSAAARRLGWQEHGYCEDVPEAGEVLLGVEDVREVPPPYGEVVERARAAELHAVANLLPGAQPPVSPRPTLIGTPRVQTSEFRAAVDRRYPADPMPSLGAEHKQHGDEDL